MRRIWREVITTLAPHGCIVMQACCRVPLQYGAVDTTEIDGVGQVEHEREGVIP